MGAVAVAELGLPMPTTPRCWLLVGAAAKAMPIQTCLHPLMVAPAEVLVALEPKALAAPLAPEEATEPVVLAPPALKTEPVVAVVGERLPVGELQTVVPTPKAQAEPHLLMEPREALGVVVFQGDLVVVVAGGATAAEAAGAADIPVAVVETPGATMGESEATAGAEAATTPEQTLR